MNIIEQINKLIDETEFSEKVSDKIKEFSAKMKLRKELGKEDQDCLTAEEKEELLSLIKTDMALDSIEVKIYQAFLNKADKALTEVME
jgi:hypothetical protein